MIHINTTDESQNHYAEWKKLYRKEIYIVQVLLYEVLKWEKSMVEKHQYSNFLWEMSQEFTRK